MSNVTKPRGRYHYVVTILLWEDRSTLKVPFASNATKTGTVHEVARQAAEAEGHTGFEILLVVPDLNPAGA